MLDQCGVGLVHCEEMNGKRSAELGPGRAGKKVKKEVMANISDAVTEETLKKQVAEAWSRRTPFRHGKRDLKGEAQRRLGASEKVLAPELSAEQRDYKGRGFWRECDFGHLRLLPGLLFPFSPSSVWI